jgi:hypothetical protein
MTASCAAQLEAEPEPGGVEEVGAEEQVEGRRWVRERADRPRTGVHSCALHARACGFLLYIVRTLNARSSSAHGRSYRT